MDKNEIDEILTKHKNWIESKDGGKKADLRGVDLKWVDLSGSDLRGAYLSGADLSGSDLRGAYLNGSDLRGADLSEADLRGAYIRKSDLRGADLSGADFRGAYLEGSDLSGSKLRDACFSGADIRCAIIEESIKEKFFPLTCPGTGDFIGWKQAEGKIVKLKITGKRSSAYGRKCRCSEAEVLAIENKDGTQAKVQKVMSNLDPDFCYEVGKTVSVEDFDDDRWIECSAGIHFFITRQEAVDYKE